jgi:hypothetical protein
LRPSFSFLEQSETLLILFKSNKLLFEQVHSCAFGDNDRNVVCLVARAELTDVARNR